jgi:hypothetical protein
MAAGVGAQQPPMNLGHRLKCVLLRPLCLFFSQDEQE